MDDQKICKQQEEKLQLTQFALDNLPDAVYWLDPDAKFIYVNNAATEATGYSKEELLSMTAHDIAPEFQVDVWPAHWAELRKKRSLVINTFHQRKDKSTFPVEITVNLINFEGREVNCALAKDITERKQTEEKLVYSEQLYKEAQSIAHIGHWNYNKREDILFWSDELYSIFEIDKDAGTPTIEIFLDRIHPDDRDAINEQLREGHSYRSDYRIIMNNGLVKYIHEDVEIIYREDGGVEMIKGTAQDITERKRAEEEIIRLKDGLEIEVEKKTKDLKEKISDLQRFYDASVGRELRMEELYNENEKLKAELKKQG